MRLDYCLCCAHGKYVGARGDALISRPDLIFRWAIKIADEIHEAEVCVRADNASERCVPSPGAWHHAMRCGDLASRAEEAGHSLEAMDGVSELSSFYINPISVMAPVCTVLKCGVFD